MRDVPLAEVTRGAAVESVHRGCIAVVHGGELVFSAGDVDAPIWTRSAVKPFQALPLVESSVRHELELNDRELALISASHDSTTEHVAAVRGLLERAGFDEAALGCGPHAPFDRDSSLAIARSGGKPQKVHNNCSGKHTGFLLLARHLGAPLDGYLDPEAEPQRTVCAAVADMTGADLDHTMIAIDGCGAPTMRLPLVGLARGFERLIDPTGLSDSRQDACRRLLAAISAEPFYLAGRARLCTALIRSAPGSIYPKNGAEGVYVFGVSANDVTYGVAIKVSDGATRGYLPVAVELLLRLGLWSEIPAELERFARVPVPNTQRRLVGEVRSCVEWPASFDPA